MITVISWLVILGPLIKALLTKVLPKLFARLRGVGGKLTGNAEGLGGGPLVLGDLALGDSIRKTGAIGAILFVLGRIWGWFCRFPSFLKDLFGPTGTLFFIRPILEFIAGCMKTPVLLFFSLLMSAYFPTILEKIFLLVGAVSMHIFIMLFDAGKRVFDAMQANMTQNGSAVDEFKTAVLGSFDQLPPCMVDVMGYVHMIEDLGMIVTCAMLLLLVGLFKTIYGSFGPRPLGWFA